MNFMDYLKKFLKKLSEMGKKDSPELLVIE